MSWRPLAGNTNNNNNNNNNNNKYLSGLGLRVKASCPSTISRFNNNNNNNKMSYNNYNIIINICFYYSPTVLPYLPFRTVK